MLRCIVCHVLKHANSYQVVVDIAPAITGVHVNCVKDGNEVLLAESIDVVADDKLETAEATSYNLVTFMLKRLANSHYNDAPSLVLYLLSACLNYLFEAFDDSKLIRVVCAF